MHTQTSVARHTSQTCDTHTHSPTCMQTHTHVHYLKCRVKAHLLLNIKANVSYCVKEAYLLLNFDVLHTVSFSSFFLILCVELMIFSSLPYVVILFKIKYCLRIIAFFSSSLVTIILRYLKVEFEVKI